MTQYVLSYAFPYIGSTSAKIVLVEKLKPEWQCGLLNLPGGKIEAGETPEEAACRELKEETALDAVAADAKVLGVIEGDDFAVHVVSCGYRSQWWNGEKQEARKMTDEEVVTLDFRVALNDPRLIPNLKIIIPLCMANLAGWRLRDPEPFSSLDNSWKVWLAA